MKIFAQTSDNSGISEDNSFKEDLMMVAEKKKWAEEDLMKKQPDVVKMVEVEPEHVDIMDELPKMTP
jgi:hypothetical protein